MGSGYESASLLVKHDGISCIRFSGTVPDAHADPYSTTGKYDVFHETKSPVVLLNIGRSAMTFSSLPFPTQVYDHRSELRIMSTPKGGTVTVPSYRHAHWKTRMNDCIKIANDISGPVLLIGDVGSYDEMYDSTQRVTLHQLTASEPRALILFRDGEPFFDIVKGSIKRKQRDDDDAYVLNAFCTAPGSGVIMEITPQMDLTGNAPNQYMNILFGSYHLALHDFHTPIEHTICLPMTLRMRNDLMSLITVSDHIVNGTSGVAYGFTSQTLMFKILPQSKDSHGKDSHVWSITIVLCGDDVGDNDGVATDNTICTGEEFLKRMLQLNKVKTDMTLAYQMMNMTVEPDTINKFTQAPDFERLWKKTIETARMRWNSACVSFDTHMSKLPIGFAAPVRQYSQF